MEKSINKSSLLKNSLSVFIAVAGAIALPQIFHALGIATGAYGKLGQMFLPMYLPVMILAFKSNAIMGVTAGVLSPIISFALTGMPTASSLPLITIELACFGLFAGLLGHRKINPFLKIFIVQLSSRVVRIAATLTSLCFITNASMTSAAVLSSIVIAIPGYALQLLTVPFFMSKGVANHE